MGRLGGMGPQFGVLSPVEHGKKSQCSFIAKDAGKGLTLTALQPGGKMMPVHKPDVEKNMRCTEPYREIQTLFSGELVNCLVLMTWKHVLIEIVRSWFQSLRMRHMEVHQVRATFVTPASTRPCPLLSCQGAWSCTCDSEHFEDGGDRQPLARGPDEE